MALTCLIFLTTSCATSSLPHYSKILKDQPAPADGQFVTDDGARLTAKIFAEHTRLKEEVKNDTFWNSLTHNFTMFGLGVGVGVVTGVIILP